MTIASFSLQQLQAYRRRHDDDARPEVLCTAFALSRSIEIEALRQGARETLAYARIPWPDMARETACTVAASDARTLEAACAQALLGLLARGEACGLELALTDDGVRLVAVGVSWLFDAQGLARFAAHAIERATGVTLLNDVHDADVSYADYIGWQRELAASPEAHFGRQYWTRRTAHFKPLADLLLEEKLQPAAPGTAAFELRRLRAETAQGLQAQALRHGGEPGAIVLAAWLVVLERLRPEQRKDLVVAVSGRDETFGHLVGRLSLELPLSFHIGGQAPFASLVKHVGERLEEADEWKECYGEQHLSIDGERSALRFSTRKLHHAQSTGFTYREIPCAPANPSSRLEFVVMEGAESAIALYGDPARYSSTTVEFLLTQCEAVLARAIADPLSSVDALIEDGSPIEADSIESGDGNAGGTRPVAADRSTESAGLRIEAALTRHADAIAIRHGARALTYAALADRIDAQQCALARCGLGVEDAIGVATDDPVAYFVAALAAWRIGAHFVALGADSPPARIADIVEQTGVRVIVDPHGTVQAIEGAAARRSSKTAPADSSGTAHRFVPLDALAYVVFTSGTSGQPRAVAISHRALANQLDGLSRRVPLAASELALVRTPATFDASLWEWLYPLAQGATLHVLDAGDAFSEPTLMSLLRNWPIALAQMTPSLLRRCLQAGGEDALARVGQLVIGGEPFGAELVAPIARNGGTLVNAYGPSETCINASLYCVTSDRHTRSVPIGQPLDGYVFHIVDTALRPVATGRTGMLCIGGEGLARGLVREPATTAAVFLPDPFSGVPGARIYVTGDLVRRLPNGDVEFVGRADNQLKLNGVRIDGAEIVAAMTAERSVKEAALVMLDDPSPALIGCVVPTAANHFSADALRVALRTKLPSSMCPATFVALEALPLDAHGKLDRRALRERAAAAFEVAYVAPRTETERRVAQCWRAVLNVERVGVHDNFFLSGGHSLTFGRLIVALREAFDVQLPFSGVIAAPSVAALAAYIDATRGEESGVAPI